MKSKTLILVAAVLAIVIAGFFAFGPRGGQQVAEEVPAPAAEAPAEAVVTPETPAAEAAPAAVEDVAPTGDVAVQPDSFAVPAVDLDLPTEDKPAAAPAAAAPAEAAPADTAPQQ